MTGRTGPAKGVVYTHGMFEAQVVALLDTYGFRPGEVDCAAFPLFSLFDGALGMTSVILTSNGEPLYLSTDAARADDADVESRIPIGDNASLYLRGPDLATSDRRILGAFVSQIETAVRQRELAAEAATMRPVAEADRMRTALLAAVGHDLRNPVMVAQVDEQHAAMVTLAMHPARQADVQPDLGGGQSGASVRAIGVHDLYSVCWKRHRAGKPMRFVAMPPFVKRAHLAMGSRCISMV